MINIDSRLLYRKIKNKSQENLWRHPSSTWGNFVNIKPSLIQLLKLKYIYIKIQSVYSGRYGMHTMKDETSV